MNDLIRSSLTFLVLLSAVLRAENPPGVTVATELELLRVARISGDAKHNAFTALVRIKDAFYCTWREASSHVSADGKLRVVRSADGTNWTSVALLTRAGVDLRDSKIEVTPDNRLMLHACEKFPAGSSPLRRNLAWFSTDGTTWSDPVHIAEDDIWFWKHTWHKGTGYGVGYACAAPWFARLYTSKDGAKWTTHVATLNNSGYVNESSIVFMPDDTAHCLLRRDEGTRTALLGTAAPPYTNWKWQDLGRQIGGPEMIRLPDNRLLAAVRLLNPNPQATWLCWVSPKSGTLTPALKLPSRGDTSYAGMVWHDDRLWVSYYSSHEKRTGVYIAEVAYRPDGKTTTPTNDKPQEKPAPATTQAQEPRWTLAWEDDFNADKLDATKWTIIERGRSDCSRHMSNDPACYAFRDGKLALRGLVNTNPADDAKVITGGITTKETYSFTYGKVEIRAKLGHSKGAWPAFWMKPTQRHPKFKHNGEIDLMEHLNFDKFIYQTVHTHYTLDLGIKNKPVSHATAKFNPDDFNTFGLEWFPDKLVFTVNGQPTFTYPRIQTEKEGQWFFDQPFYLIIGMQLGGNWVGIIEESQLPVEMEIDWVKIYQDKSVTGSHTQND